jgi:hypothetical protein
MFHDLAWTMAFDSNPQQAVDRRRAVFGELAEKRNWVFGFRAWTKPTRSPLTICRSAGDKQRSEGYRFRSNGSGASCNS